MYFIYSYHVYDREHSLHSGIVVPNDIETPKLNYATIHNEIARFRAHISTTLELQILLSS